MKKKFYIALVLAGIFSGCGFGTSGPQVLSTDPLNGASAVALNKTVTATFGSTMDAATITSTTFTLVGDSAVAGTVSLDSTQKIASFDPTSDLTANIEFTGTITNGATDTDGNTTDSNYVWTFSTGSTAAPTVSSTDPASAATGVLLSKVITATFSTAMNPATLTTTTFTISGVSGTVTVDSTNKIASFTPLTALLPSTTFNATITTGAQDSNANPLTSNYTWSFTTGTGT
ncbi:MAG: Ig-like domain-containing protein [Deltaproteobacteria bacterium]|nr:Ig-like domain-containing protein [Deltaproteobacteria bacterium]